jgi:hypothetical protein
LAEKLVALGRLRCDWERAGEPKASLNFDGFRVKH